MSLRLFAAFELSEEAAARAVALQRGVDGASWRPRENLHVTLRFFGDLPEDVARDVDAALEEAAQGHGPFDMRLKGAGSFGKDDPHTLWLGLAPLEPLKRLAGDIERAVRRAGVKPETRAYAPHVTVAYLHGADPARVRAFESRYGLFESPAWTVDRFGLYSSWLRKRQPSLYRLEAEYPLLG